jgi:nucleoside-diphosphate-sugar epimerase
MDSNVEFISEEQRKRPEKSEVQRLWCDNTKIEKLTGFKPSLSLEDGLKKTIDWFKKEENLKKYKADIYNV